MKRFLAIVAYSVVMVLWLAAPAAYAADCPQAGCLAGKPGDLNVPDVTAGETAKGVINILSFTAGVVSVVFLVIGGLRYSSSGGNSTKIEGAKQTILYAIIGLIISVLAIAIVGFVIKSGP